MQFYAELDTPIGINRLWSRNLNKISDCNFAKTAAAKLYRGARDFLFCKLARLFFQEAVVQTG